MEDPEDVELLISEKLKDVKENELEKKQDLNKEKNCKAFEAMKNTTSDVGPKLTETEEYLKS